MPTRLNYEHGCNARRANTPRLAQAPKEHTHTKTQEWGHWDSPTTEQNKTRCGCSRRSGDAAAHVHIVRVADLEVLDHLAVSLGVRQGRAGRVAATAAHLAQHEALVVEQLLGDACTLVVVALRQLGALAVSEQLQVRAIELGTIHGVGIVAGDVDVLRVDQQAASLRHAADTHRRHGAGATGVDQHLITSVVRHVEVVAGLDETTLRMCTTANGIHTHRHAVAIRHRRAGWRAGGAAAGGAHADLEQVDVGIREPHLVLAVVDLHGLRRRHTRRKHAVAARGGVLGDHAGASERDDGLAGRVGANGVGVLAWQGGGTGTDAPGAAGGASERVVEVDAASVGVVGDEQIGG
mmetsp:Transcript_6617/g.13673  ORF Transcript_6617/g.13673 Transcript_6617/m.13673 type:complete len:351 (+) Transcript_6617:46-1098(+)